MTDSFVPQFIGAKDDKGKPGLKCVKCGGIISGKTLEAAGRKCEKHKCKKKVAWQNPRLR